MNSLTPYIVGSSCILKTGDTADHRMTELNVLIASGKGSIRAFTELPPRVQKRDPSRPAFVGPPAQRIRRRSVTGRVLLPF